MCCSEDSSQAAPVIVSSSPGGCFHVIENSGPRALLSVLFVHKDESFVRYTDSMFPSVMDVHRRHAHNSRLMMNVCSRWYHSARVYSSDDFGEGADGKFSLHFHKFAQ